MKHLKHRPKRHAAPQRVMMVRHNDEANVQAAQPGYIPGLDDDGDDDDLDTAKKAATKGLFQSMRGRSMRGR